MKKLIRNLILIMVLFTFSITGVNAKTYNVTMVDGTFKYKEAKEVFDIVNEERIKNGKSALKYDADLTESAMKRARETVLNFSHTRASGTSWYTIINTANGENIAVGYSTAKATMNQWMNSDGHKANILNSGYKSMGVGVYKHGDMYYWVQLFSVTDNTSNVTKTGDVLDKSPKEVIDSAFINELEILYNYNYMVNKNTIKLNVGRSIAPYRTQGVNAGWNYVAYMLTPTSFTYQSLNTNIFKVDKNGKITALKPGTAKMKVILGDKSKEYTIKVYAPIKSVKLNKTEVSIKKKGTYNLKATLNPTNTTDSKKITWTSSNKKIVTVDKFGKIKGIKNGSATITAKTSNGKTAKVKVIVGPVSVKNLKVSSIANQAYTGKNIKPKLTIKWGNTKLVNGKDYTVTYKNNKKFGTSSVTIKFKGKYTGSKSLKFNIVPKKVTINNPISNKKSITVKFNKVSGVKYYEIAYRIKGTNNWKVITTTSNNKKLTGLVSNKNYQIRVRGIVKVNGKAYTGSWSSIKTIVVK